MQVEYALTRDDYVAANRAHLKLLFTSGVAWVCPAILGAVAGYLLVRDHCDCMALGEQIALGMAVGLAVTFGFWLCLFGLSALSLRRRSDRMFRQQRRLGEQTRLTWDHDLLHSESASATTHTPWGDFLRGAESREALLLFPNEVYLYLIPNRALNAETRAALIDRLNTHRIPQWRRWRHFRRPEIERGRGVPNG